MSRATIKRQASKATTMMSRAATWPSVVVRKPMSGPEKNERK